MRLHRQSPLTLSNVLTVSRIAAIPFIMNALSVAAWSCALWLFIGSAFTDALDGFFARLWRQQTVLGVCLDPLADKLLVLSCFFMLWSSPVTQDMIPAWFVGFIGIKESLFVLGASLLYGLRGVVIKATRASKCATTLQLLFLFLLLYTHAYGQALTPMLHRLLYCVTGLMVFVVMQYAFLVRKALCGVVDG